MGNIGARISQAGRNLGRRASGGIQRGVQNSDRFKSWQKYQQDQGSARRAGRVYNRLMRRGGGDVKNLSERDQSRVAEARKILNADTERKAEARAGILPLEEGVADMRAESRIEAQELKNFQDQFAGYTRDQLLAESGAGTGAAPSWYDGSRASTQRMKALLGAMEANGMQNDMYGMLRNTNVGNNASVMQALANSKDKVLKAYGKKGGGMSYSDFMSNAIYYKDTNGDITTDATKAAPGTGPASMMAQYINEKGSDFIDGLDDKSLGAILKDSKGDAISTGLLMEAAARINSQDAVEQIDKILEKRASAPGFDFSTVKFSAAQLARFNTSTVGTLAKIGGTNSDVEQAIINASNEVAGNADLLNAMDPSSRAKINEFRNARSLGSI